MVSVLFASSILGPKNERSDLHKHKSMQGNVRKREQRESDKAKRRVREDQSQQNKHLISPPVHMT
jgi:hypothetical protein